jgi:large subunit ribosomal protein L21
MFAVMLTGGKQHKVREGDVLKLQKMAQEVGQSVEFDQVLMVSNDKDLKIGAPYLDASKIVGEIVEHGRHKKISIIKLRRRKHSMNRQGHRQDYTAVRIKKIEA